MIRHIVNMVAGDTGPPLEFSVVNDDAVYDLDTNELITPATPFDLTGCTVRFSIKNPSGTVVNAAHKVCEVTDELLGLCRYAFYPGDIVRAGRHQCDVEVTDSSSRIQTEFTVTDIMVREAND